MNPLTSCNVVRELTIESAMIYKSKIKFFSLNSTLLSHCWYICFVDSVYKVPNTNDLLSLT